jgi:hypothetical protein
VSWDSKEKPKAHLVEMIFQRPPGRPEGLLNPGPQKLNFYSVSLYLFYYCFTGNIVILTKVLRIYHSWIHPPTHHSPLSSLTLIPHSWNSFSRSHFSTYSVNLKMQFQSPALLCFGFKLGFLKLRCTCICVSISSLNFKILHEKKILCNFFHWESPNTRSS